MENNSHPTLIEEISGSQPYLKIVLRNLIPNLFRDFKIRK